MHSTRVLFARSVWKGPHIVPLPIVRPKPGETVKPIRTKARSATILPNFIGLKFQVHNGKIYHDITITEDMVGHKLGEFSPENLTLKTIYGETTLEEALLEEHNMLHKLKYWQKREDLLRYLEDHTNDIEATVSHLLALDKTKRCRVEPVDLWRHGSFNMCIPIHVTDRRGQQRERFIIRFPLPYKIGEETFPGNADEKLRCEAATYIWISQNCPDVPIPRLLGFSFDGMQYFIPLDKAPWYTRWTEYIRRYFRSLFGHAPLSPYLRGRNLSRLKYGFLLISYIERHDGIMLLETWEDQQHDKAKRTNLFRGLSQIMLSLSRIPLPRIGSFTLDDQGVLSLTNRPLTLRLHELENEGVPTGIARSDTYTSIEPYTLDLLGYHESLLRHRPNSINSKLDCEAQMAVLAGMRAVLPHFIERGLRNGPFQLTLTDFSRANIYVDKDWHIKFIIDLEWACSLPVQMQNSPYWLTNRGVDQLQGHDFTEYKDMHDEFMEAFEKEERLQHTGLPEGVNAPHTRVMRRSWDSGGFFYFHALDTTVGLFNLFWQHIWPRFPHFSKEPEKAFEEAVFPFWSFDAQSVTAAKLKDREEYETKLRTLFNAGVDDQPQKPTASDQS
ncbi:MAG: hypothetical protein LQ341_001187 [Variospora aurantia]|nr:MAG: hypothetical protein LQ341_001187 [Variospora aurantia]